MADSPCPNTTAVRRAPRGSGAADRTAIDSGTAGEPAAGGVSAAGAPAGRSNAGGTQRTAAHLAHAPAGRSARAVTAFDRKLMLIGLLLHSATQVVSLMAWHTLPFSEKSQRLGSIVFAACSWLLPTLAPAFYLRWRKELIILYRICFFAFPLLRKARGIQQVMEDAAQQGARGAVKDLFKIFWGSRLMAVFMASMLNPLPLLPLVPHLLLQVYTVAMVRHNPSLCSTALLNHPLTVKRIHGLHSIMHLTAFALPGGVGQSLFPLLERSPNQQEAECESFLSFYFYAAGLLLPLWVLVKTEPPSSLAEWEERSSSTEQCARLGVLGRVEAALEGAVRQVCGRSWLAPPIDEEEEEGMMWAATSAQGQGPNSGGIQHKRRLRLRGWERVFAWWLVLALLWAVCISSHVT